MSIRFLASSEKHKMDMRLMSLKDFWTLVYGKDKAWTYAKILKTLEDKNFRPIAVDDNGNPLYACHLEKVEKSVEYPNGIRAGSLTQTGIKAMVTID